MSEVGEYTISLRFFGDELDPDTMSPQLGGTPTYACRKGDIFHGTSGDRVEKTGKWFVRVVAKAGDSFEPLIDNLLNGLTQDIAVWQSLSRAYAGDLYCGVWLDESNQGMELSPGLMLRLAKRGLHLGLDIYAPSREDDG